MKRTSWRWALVTWLAAMLIGSGLGCNPASTTPSATTPRTTPQPDKKGDSVKPPPADPG